VVRVVETAGREGPARIVLPAWDRLVPFEIGPFQIRTFRIPRDPSGPAVETDLLERPLDGALEDVAEAAGPDPD